MPFWMSFDHTNPRCSDFSSFDFSNCLGAEVFSELAAEAWPYESERPPNRIKEGRLQGNGPRMGIQNKLPGGVPSCMIIGKEGYIYIYIYIYIYNVCFFHFYLWN